MKKAKLGSGKDFSIYSVRLLSGENSQEKLSSGQFLAVLMSWI